MSALQHRTVEANGITIAGRKTRTVFDRYHIESPADLQNATRQPTTALPGRP